MKAGRPKYNVFEKCNLDHSIYTTTNTIYISYIAEPKTFEVHSTLNNIIS